MSFNCYISYEIFPFTSLNIIKLSLWPSLRLIFILNLLDFDFFFYKENKKKK